MANIKCLAEFSFREVYDSLIENGWKEVLPDDLDWIEDDSAIAVRFEHEYELEDTETSKKKAPKAERLT